MASKGLQVLATAMAIAASVDGPYSSQGLRLPKSKPVSGTAVCCFECGSYQGTLRKFGDKRICQSCFAKDLERRNALADATSKDRRESKR